MSRLASRAERAARLFNHARRALGTDAEAHAFLTTPHPMLDGQTPIEAPSNPESGRTEQILLALEHGLAP